MSPPVPRWARETLPKLDKRLFVIFNTEEGYWEVWLRKNPHLPVPANVAQAEDWQYRPPYRGDYMKIMNCLVDDVIAEPGPWLGEVLRAWDTRLDGERNLKRWQAMCKEEKRKQRERGQAEYRDSIETNRRAIVRGMEGRSPHGGLVQVAK